MDAVEVVGFEQELVALHVPRDVPGFRLDLEILPGGDVAALPLLEVSLVTERQCPPRLVEHRERVLRRRLALGVEVSARRGGLRGHRGCLFGHHVTGNGKGGSHGGKVATAFSYDCITPSGVVVGLRTIWSIDGHRGNSS